MNKVIFIGLSSISLALFACNQPTSTASDKTIREKSESTSNTGEVKEDQQQNTIHTAELFTLTHAEKILGEPGHLTDSLSTFKVDTFEFKNSYAARDKERKTGKTGNVYFMYEQYDQLAAAKNTYSSIKSSNQNHEGVKVLEDLGDEAYFHTDGQNFYFILVRKGKRMFRIKVNKITGSTSLDAFNLVAKNLVAAL